MKTRDRVGETILSRYSSRKALDGSIGNNNPNPNPKYHDDARLTSIRFRPLLDLHETKSKPDQVTLNDPELSRAFRKFPEHKSFRSMFKR